MTKWPTIYKAAELIVRDGGGINREHTLEQHQLQVGVVLDFNWDARDLDRVGRYLSGLTEEQLTLLCTGDEDEVKSMGFLATAPDFLDDLLEELSAC